MSVRACDEDPRRILKQGAFISGGCPRLGSGALLCPRGGEGAAELGDEVGEPAAGGGPGEDELGSDAGHSGAGVAEVDGDVWPVA
jgi:hypothetical protein